MADETTCRACGNQDGDYGSIPGYGQVCRGCFDHFLAAIPSPTPSR